MKTNDYLNLVLDAQTLAPDSDEVRALPEARDAVEKLLRDAFEGCSPTIRYGGSKAKNTMIKESYDLDLIFYLPHDEDGAGKTLANIFQNVRGALQSKYSIEEKRSAIRLYDQEHADFHIDVVPGRFTDDTKTDAFIYQAEGEKSRLKTNLQVHIDHIKDGGVTDAIKLMKVWSVRNSAPVKTFILELLTVKLLEGMKGDDLETQFVHVMKELRDNLENIHVEDPANPSGNDLSALWDAGLRIQLSYIARDTLLSIEDENWEGVFGQVVDLSPEEAVTSFSIIASEAPEQTRPWCDVSKKK